MEGYHGTTATNARSIAEYSYINPSQDGKVYFTVFKHLAEAYARTRAQEYGDDPAMVRIRIDDEAQVDFNSQDTTGGSEYYTRPENVIVTGVIYLSS